MRIGELAERAGVSADTLRFYEKEGWLPRPARAENGYRSYGEADVEHLRLLIDLRRLEIPLGVAAQLASWCHAGHCQMASDSLPALIASRRAAIRERLARLVELDARLADLETHLVAVFRPGASSSRLGLTVLDPSGPCCDAAAAVSSVAEGGCGCRLLLS